MKRAGIASLAIAMVLVASVVRADSGLANAADDGVKEKVKVKDVALRTNGELLGQVVDSAGVGVAGVPVSLRSRDREIASVTTDEKGEFVIEGMKGGVYEVSAPQNVADYRVWTSEAAPPICNEKVVLIQNTPPCPPILPVADPVPVVPVSAPVPVVPPAAPAAAAPGIGAGILASAAVATAIAVPVSLTSRPGTPVSP